ncbi:sensor histidine kinase [Chthonobacter albigriseus]|uniref:sensor histidine kinase n=1 Tax=Chthonobacter albigriseus TaxID=1683161 RepID=UPI0015EFCEA3|nr:PAS domain-containing sensor histidine kinase [Chthonobacter albigriseus]
MPAFRRGDVVLAAMPVIAIVLLVTLLGLLLWILDRDEKDLVRTTLISDALWVEQTLRFQLTTDEDIITRLALDAGRPDADREALVDRLRIHVVSNPEVIAVRWYGPDGTAVASVPAGRADGPLPAVVERARALGQGSARPVYGDLETIADGTLTVDMARPVADGGVLVATVSVSALIARHVPWWIGEKYAVRLLDSTGRVLAEKSSVEPVDPSLFHRIAFDPPIKGTWLAISPYRLASGFSNNLLVGAIVGLAALAVASLVGLQRHVARRRRAEQQLRAETAFRRSMEDSLTVGLRARDLDGRILYVNQAFCRMVGWSAEELVGLGPPMPYWQPDQVEETQARHDALIHGERRPKSWETRLRRKDGSSFDALLYEAPLIDADGVFSGWMGSIIDVTDRKVAAELSRRQAESLQRTGRLITLGEMASTLAHELNQPLAAIASYAAGSLNVLRGPAPDARAVEAALEKLAVQAQRAGQIIRRIQDFVRKREPRFGPVPTADLVAETVAFTAVDARNAGVRIETRIEDDLPPIHADRILMEQALINLIRNGAEAMAGMPGVERVLTVTAARRGEEVVLAVADRGPGIDPEVDGRLFDAFVSTKAEGMGMGLNICRSIMELHKGRLVHAPREGGGTVFTLVLPVPVPAEAA